jgi:transcriptional regulator with XRE-family HTH domain
MVNRDFHPVSLHVKPAPGKFAAMASPKKPRPQTGRPLHFIAAWREHRGVSQEQLAEEIGYSEASISRVETGKQPYNQRMIEAIARALNVSVADLIAVDPAAPDPVRPLWESADADQRRQIAALAETVIGWKKDGR